MPAGLSNLSDRLNGTRQTPKKQMPSRSRTPSVPDEVNPELLAYENANIHLREQVNDEVLPMTEDAAFARCYYIDGFVNSRSKRPWEARIKLLFPQNVSWRSATPADPAQTGLPTDQYGDMCEDRHWHFGEWGCTTTSRDRFAALETPSGPSPEQMPALVRAQTSVPQPSATWPQDPSARTNQHQTPCSKPAPTPDARRNQHQQQHQKQKPKPRLFNQIKACNINLDHIANATTGCGCEKCLHRAELDYDSLGPLDVVNSDNEIATIDRPEPIAIPQPPSRASTMPLPSTPASDDGEPDSGSPRKRAGFRNLLGGLRGAKRGVAVSLSKSAASSDGLAAHMKRSDSGYESLASAAVH